MTFSYKCPNLNKDNLVLKTTLNKGVVNMHTDDTFIPSSKGNLAVSIHYPKIMTHKFIVICPSFLGSKDYENVVRMTEMFAQCGYTAVRFNPTGTWTSEGCISDYTITQYLTDIRNVIAYMEMEHNFTHSTVCGHSIGGTVALLYASKYKDVSTVISIMSPTRMPVTPEEKDLWEKKGFKISVREHPDNNTKREEFGVPFSCLTDYEGYDLIAEVSNIECEAFVFAGELDQLAPPDEMLELYEKITSEQKAFAVIPETVHDYRLNEEEIAIVNLQVFNTLGYSLF